MLAGSFVLRFAAGWMALALILFFSLAVVLFNLTSRRVRQLVEIIHEFKLTNFQPGTKRYRETQLINDEITEFGYMFNELADLVVVQLAELQRSERIRRELIENISHDVRRPLTLLLGYAETLLEKDLVLTSAEKTGYLQKVVKSSRTCIQLVSELFELSRLEGMDAPLKLESFAPADLIEDIIQGYASVSRQKNVAIQTDIPDNLPMAMADIALIERVMNNILDNALSHTATEGKITVRIVKVDEGIEISVGDSGPGISQEALPKIFDRAYCGSGKSVEAHAGLGLAICKKILDLHHSSLTVKSEENVGTTFSFRIRSS